jgi:hypothetical protein
MLVYINNTLSSVFNCTIKKECAVCAHGFISKSVRKNSCDIKMFILFPVSSICLQLKCSESFESHKMEKCYL